MYGRGHGSPGLGIGPPHTPAVIKGLLIANAAVFVVQNLLERSGFTQIFAVHPVLVWQGGYLWQPFSYMWLHGSLGHLLMNCFILWMFGSQVAALWGTRRFLRFYLVCGFGAGVIIATWPYVAVGLGLAGSGALGHFTLGASGAIFAVQLAYSLTWPDRTIMLIFPPVAFRAIWLIPVVFLMTYMMDPRGNVSHVGHLGGVIVGWLYLRRSGDTGSLLSLKKLQYRWRRYRMRRKLHAVQVEDREARRRERRDQTLH